MNRLIPAAFLVLLTVSACEERAATPPAKPSPTVKAPPATPNLDLQPTHPEPEYAAEIIVSQTTPPTYTVKWTARVDSSGWKITTESVLVEDDMGKLSARVFTIVHEPQPGDTITKTPETLTATYDAGTKVVEKIELSAKHTVRDSKPIFPQLYVIVKRVGGT